MSTVKRKKITIVEIAKEAGVGTTTVSRVLNGKSKVKKETREKILEVIKKHNFKPNSAARNLVRSSSQDQIIGLVIPQIESQFIYEVLNSFYRNLRGTNFNILIFNVEKGRKDVFSHLAHENLAGLIFFGDLPMSSDERKIIRNINIPYLYVDHHEESEHSVCFDNYTGGILAAEYLLEKGRKKITFFGRTEKTQMQNERFIGFSEKLAEFGISSVQEIYTPNEYASYDMALSLIKNDLVDGMFFFSDQLAYGGMQAKNKLRADVSLIGYDDIFPSSFMQLSTIRQSADELAGIGLKKLIELIDSPLPFYLMDPIQYILTPALVDRNS